MKVTNVSEYILLIAFEARVVHEIAVKGREAMPSFFVQKKSKE